MQTPLPFVRGADIQWQHMADGVRRQVLGYGTDLMVVRVEFEAGSIGALHRHPHRQATYVMSGRFDVTMGDEKTVLVAGDCFYAATDVEHGVRALEAGTLIDVFTPIRTEFLPQGLT